MFWVHSVTRIYGILRANQQKLTSEKYGSRKTLLSTGVDKQTVFSSRLNDDEYLHRASSLRTTR